MKELQEEREEFNRLKEEHNNTLLELQHYKERVMEQEEKIAKLRVDLTRFSNALQSIQSQQEASNVPQAQQEIVDAEVVSD